MLGRHGPTQAQSQNVGQRCPPASPCRSCPNSDELRLALCRHAQEAEQRSQTAAKRPLTRSSSGTESEFGMCRGSRRASQAGSGATGSCWVAVSNPRQPRKLSSRVKLWIKKIKGVMQLELIPQSAESHPRTKLNRGQQRPSGDGQA